MERHYNGVVENGTEDGLLLVAEEALAHGRPPIPCPDCGGFMKLGPNRFGSLSFDCIKLGCSGTHRATPDGRPMGIPGNKETRYARHLAYEALKVLWERGWVPSKARAYSLVWGRAGFSVSRAPFLNVASMNISQCESVIQAVDDILDVRLAEYRVEGESIRYLKTGVLR